MIGNEYKISRCISMESDHRMTVNQLMKHWEASQMEVSELRDAVSAAKRRLVEERYDRQRNTLLHVVVTKLKTELDKKEKQMDLLKHIAQQLQARIEDRIGNDSDVSCDSCGSSAQDPNSTQDSGVEPATDEESTARLELTVADLRHQNTLLQTAINDQKRQLEQLQSEVPVL